VRDPAWFHDHHVEGVMISPQWFHLLGLLDMADGLTSLLAKDRAVQVTAADITKYFTFTRLMRGYDALACDWCTVMNGTIQLILDRILQHFGSTEFDFQRFMLHFNGQGPLNPVATLVILPLLKTLPTSPLWSPSPEREDEKKEDGAEPRAPTTRGHLGRELQTFARTLQENVAAGLTQSQCTDAALKLLPLLVRIARHDHATHPFLLLVTFAYSSPFISCCS
jgi:hypothetical protein